MYSRNYQREYFLHVTKQELHKAQWSRTRESRVIADRGMFTLRETVAATAI